MTNYARSNGAKMFRKLSSKLLRSFLIRGTNNFSDGFVHIQKTSLKVFGGLNKCLSDQLNRATSVSEVKGNKIRP